LQPPQFQNLASCHRTLDVIRCKTIQASGTYLTQWEELRRAVRIV